MSQFLHEISSRIHQRVENVREVTAQTHTNRDWGRSTLKGLAGHVTFRPKLKVDRLFPLYLLWEFLRAVRKVVLEKNGGRFYIRKVEYLNNLGFQITHRIWLQLLVGWPALTENEIQSSKSDAGRVTLDHFTRSLYLNICDHFQWVS
eukprot:Protomagalhaensia_sp_Gyna_25__2010@NODE_207_length_4407_cov_256_562729_g161_i0_p4_GENE_NODE_207_length_4407_cov_256_562729_g161_i0NODE_207_length_4407_cov_256_562729_g161_i0_p4_ORF_typecomplete_len147_score10_91_NODE_207_length_4407_cov_256_562729_g161_i037954235